MAGNNAAFIVDKHRNRPSPFADRRRDLVDLFRAMRAGIAGIWDQRRNRAPFNFICWPFWLQNYVLLGSGVVPRSLRPRCHAGRAQALWRRAALPNPTPI